MTPKEVVQKGYDCFASGDMETFVRLFHEDCTVNKTACTNSLELIMG